MGSSRVKFISEGKLPPGAQEGLRAEESLRRERAVRRVVDNIFA